MTRVRAPRRLAAAVGAAALLGLTGVLLAGGGRSHADGTASDVPTTLPALGTLDPHAVIMGAATAALSSVHRRRACTAT